MHTDEKTRNLIWRYCWLRIRKRMDKYGFCSALLVSRAILNGKCAALAVNFALWSTRSWQNDADSGRLSALKCNLLLGKCEWHNLKVHWRERVETHYALWTGYRACSFNYFDRRDGLSWQAQNRERKWNRKTDQDWVLALNGPNKTDSAECKCVCHYEHALGVGHCCVEALWETHFSSYAEHWWSQEGSQTARRSPTHSYRIRFYLSGPENRRLLWIRLIYASKRRIDATNKATSICNLLPQSWKASNLGTNRPIQVKFYVLPRVGGRWSVSIVNSWKKCHFFWGRRSRYETELLDAHKSE